MLTNKHKLFVYGTLKRGGKLHGILQHTRFVGPTTVQGLLFVPGGSWYPSAIPGEGTIFGELYDDISDLLLKRLDAAEGVPFLFQRELVRCGSGEEAWVYWYQRPLKNAKRLENGVFPI